ncbi:MAG: hypothetical protein R6X25_08360 [Candidatus Krumholzibacteriia bacterium]
MSVRRSGSLPAKAPGAVGPGIAALARRATACTLLCLLAGLAPATHVAAAVPLQSSAAADTLAAGPAGAAAPVAVPQPVPTPAAADTSSVGAAAAADTSVVEPDGRAAERAAERTAERAADRVAERERATERAAAAAELDVWGTGVSATAAVLMTPTFPGWGQLYTDSTWQAVLAWGTQTYFWSNLLSRDRKARRVRVHAGTLAPGSLERQGYDELAEEYWELMRDFAWWSGGALLIIALDAYVGANLFRFEEDPLPVPDRWDEQLGRDLPEPPGAGAAPMITVFRWRTSF